MSYEEFVKWSIYFRDHPVDYRDDHRTYLLLRAQGVKASAEEMFPTLKQIKTSEINKQTPDRAVPKGQFLDRMLKARGGDGTTFNMGNKNENNT